MADVTAEPAPAASSPRGSLLSRSRTSAVALNVAVVVTVSLALGLIQLGRPSVWVDEAFTARAVQLPFPDYLVEQFHWLYYALLKPWTALVGTTEWAIRLPSVFAAMAACALLVVLAHKLFDRWVALAAGLLLALSPFFVQWSQQARSYTLLVAVTVVATLLLLRALEQRSRSTWLGYGIAFAAVLVLQPVSALVVVPTHLVLAYQRRTRLVSHALIAVIVVVGLGVPWLMVVAAWTSSFWVTAPSASDALGAMADISGAIGLGIPLALAGTWILVRRSDRDPAVWLAAWAFAPFVLAAVISIVKPVFLDRYLIAAAPGFALLSGVAVVEAGRRFRPVIVVAVATATAFGLVSWYSYDGRDNWRGENWSAAVATVLERRTTEPVVVVPWWASPAATYYGAPAEDTSTADEIWVLTWSERGHELPASLRRQLGFGRHRLVERLQFGWRVSAQRWQRSP